MSGPVARLHIELPDELHDAVKRVASERGQTLKGLVIVALRGVVADWERESAEEDKPRGPRSEG